MRAASLLEDFSLVELPSLLVGADPAEVLLDGLLGLRLGVVQFGPFVGLIVRLPVGAEGEGQILALEHPHSRDTVVVVLAEDAARGEGVFVQLLQTLEHSWKLPKFRLGSTEIKHCRHFQKRYFFFNINIAQESTAGVLRGMRW